MAVVLIGFGSVYIYYSTGNDTADPKGYLSIRGLNNAEDMIQIGDTKWILTGNLGDKSWKNGGLYLIDSESLEWKEVIPGRAVYTMIDISKLIKMTID